MTRTIFAAACALVAIAAALSGTPALGAGRFAYVEGPVTVIDASGGSRAVRTGDRITERDTVHVGQARAQIRFDDKAWVSLQPRTDFAVKEYVERDGGSVTLSLLKGSLRAVTGVFAARNPARYRMETPVATIGIRGTSFVATFCIQSCNVPDGLYVTGGDGTTFVQNGRGELDLSRGRTAFVASLDTPPRESDVKPVAAVSPLTTSQEMANAGSTTPGELRPGNFIYFESGLGFTPPLEVRSITSGGAGGAASGTGSATVSGILEGVSQIRSDSATDAVIGAGARTTGPGERLSITLDAAQRPVSVTGSNSAGERFSVTALTVPELAFSDGILFWGRWTNAKFFFDVQSPRDNTNAFGTADLPAGSFAHYIFGIPAATVPIAGNATYTFIGGTGSTSVAGTVGAGITAGTLTANFGANSVSTNLTIDHGGTYTANGVAVLPAGNRAQFASTTGAATGPTGTHAFKFEGFFAGAPSPVGPPRAGMVWNIARPDSIVGAGAFRCATGC